MIVPCSSSQVLRGVVLNIVRHPWDIMEDPNFDSSVDMLDSILDIGIVAIAVCVLLST